MNPLRIILLSITLCLLSLPLKATTLFIFQNADRFNTFAPTHPEEGAANYSSAIGTNGEAGRVNVVIKGQHRRTLYYKQALTPSQAGITVSFDFLAEAATTNTAARVGIGFSTNSTLDFLENEHPMQVRLIKNGSTSMSLEVRGTGSASQGIVLTSGTWYRISAACIPHPANNSYTISGRLEDRGPSGNASRPTLIATVNATRSGLNDYFSNGNAACLYAGFLAQNDGGGAIAVDNYIINHSPASDSIAHKAIIETESIGNYFSPDAPLPVTVTYAKAARNHPSTITLSLLNSAGTIVATQQTSPGVRTTLPGQSAGFYRLFVTADNELLAETTMGILPPAPANAVPDTNSRFGTIAHLKNATSTDRDTLLGIAARAGIGWIREGFLWDQIEAEEGSWDWSRYDDIMRLATAHGINVLPVVCFGTTWANDAPPEAFNKHIYQPHEEPWKNYVRSLANRYPSIKTFEIWNEPNLASFWRPTPNATAYAQTAAQAYSTLKAVNPSCRVLTAGFATAATDIPADVTRHEYTFVNALYGHNPRPFDAIAYHPYTLYQHLVPPSKTVSLFTKHIENIRKGMFGNEANPEAMPLWLTEFGVSTIPRISTQRFAADHITHLLTLADSVDAVEKMFVYNLRNTGTDYTNKEHMFGLINYDNTPKPGLFAYWHFIRSTTNASVVSVENKDNNVRLQRYIDNSDPAFTRHLVIAWSDSATGVQSSLDIPAGAGNITLTNNLGAPLAVPADNLFSITTSPIYVEYNISNQM